MLHHPPSSPPSVIYIYSTISCYTTRPLQPPSVIYSAVSCYTIRPLHPHLSFIFTALSAATPPALFTPICHLQRCQLLHHLASSAPSVTVLSAATPPALFTPICHLQRCQLLHHPPSSSPSVIACLYLHPVKCIFTEHLMYVFLLLFGH